MGWRIGLAGALLAQLFVLYSPGSAVPTVSVPGLDKALHLTIFLIPALVIGRLTRSSWPLWLLAAHGVASELIQHWFIANRTGDWRDVLANLIGVGLGVLAARLVTRHRFRRADVPAGKPA